MALSSREIQELLAVLDEAGWDEARLTIGDVTLAVSNGNGSSSTPPPAIPTPQPSPAANPPAAPATAAVPPPRAAAPSGHLVTAPSVGVFWRSPEPGAPPFAETGDEVTEGQTLCIVEIMKLMQHVTADVAGVISAIHAENSDQVEFGDPLFSVEPASA